MKKLRNKKSLLQQNKSFTSSSNAIDPFTKSESLFLQKFFRYNLSDFFSQTFSSLEDGNTKLRQSNKEQRILQSLTFTTKTKVNVLQFSSAMNEFYQSPNQQGQVSFKYLYSNSSIENLQKDEKVIVWVKMRCEVQTIENLPIQIFEELERFSNETTPAQEGNLANNIKNSPTNVINLFIVYFGDINFHLFDKKNYGIKQIELFGRVSSVRIYVFYISRLSLINRFKKINKINQNVCLNDLLIQLYEAKRQRMKNKRRKHAIVKQEYKQNRMSLIMSVLKWSTVVSVSGLALALAFLKFTA